MNTKLVLSASAAFMGALGIIGSFMPQEVSSWMGAAPAGVVPLVVQLLAALLFAFAMVNWAARGSLIGGIYNRPVALGNTTHFLIGALALTKAVLSGQRQTIVVILAVVYVVFALAFFAVLFRSPVQSAADGTM